MSSPIQPGGRRPRPRPPRPQDLIERRAVEKERAELQRDLTAARMLFVARLELVGQNGNGRPVLAAPVVGSGLNGATADAGGSPSR